MLHAAEPQTWWCVRADELTAVYRFVRGLVRQDREKSLPPILDDGLEQRLWENTIGFLATGAEELKRFDVPQKRGVLLLGQPDNGKTMACRWLRAEAERRGLDWNLVTVQDYERAENDGEVDWLFECDRPGVILFDDFDTSLRRRTETHTGKQQATFLAQLDGVTPHSGVVYLFTSNLTVEELDTAMRRPGRIDVILSFAAPSARLRRRLIRERWQAEIVSHVPVETIVAETDGCSFAELEELRKLLVLRRFDTGHWDEAWALASLRDRLDVHKERRSIGFGAPLPASLAGEMTVPVAERK